MMEINYISKALKKGASYIFNFKKNKKYKKKLLKLNNPINFLNNLQKLKREKL